MGKSARGENDKLKCKKVLCVSVSDEKSWNIEPKDIKNIYFLIIKVLKYWTKWNKKSIFNLFSSPMWLGLSTGRVGSILGPTRTRPSSVGWRVEEPRTDHRKNQSSRFRVRVSIGRAGSVAKIKNGIEIWKKKKKHHWNLKNIGENWKNPPKFRRNLHFSLKIAWIFPDLAKSYQI